MSANFTKTRSREIVVLGLQDQFDKVVYGSSVERVVNPNFFENTFKAFRWLEARANTQDTPLAILFDFGVLEAENFAFVQSLLAHPVLRGIPVIGISDSHKGIDVVECLKSGIDDVYTRPISWSDLYKRIEFLNRYKTSFLQSNTEIEKIPNPVTGFKRVFDIIFASSVIIMLSPVLVLIAILIKLEGKGPVIYRSKRVGTGYQVFDFLKFRSMVVDADEKLKDLAHLNTYADGNENTAFVKLTNDPRITKIGKFIRKTSLDEMPQLFNVLKGEMSIVGNRPLPLYEAEEMVRDAWAERFLAPAGLTGLWQVNPKGKDNLTVEERVGLDIEYAKRSNFWLDMRIISKTLPAMLQKES